MTLLYAESSAVLRWLLNDRDGAAIGAVLGGARGVVASVLTPVEVGRTLVRLASTGDVSLEVRARAWASARRAFARWDLLEVTERILERVTEPFPREPIRTLDAIHLATASFVSAELTPVTVLSTDGRVRENALAMGLDVAPAGD